VQAYAAVVAQLLSSAGVRASDVQAIGAHGQTVRHQPRAFGGYRLHHCRSTTLPCWPS
jgi:anhydro-N-acetylmuramic acid kinase